MALIAVITLYTCIDPYTPTLKGYESMLVVEGIITDENTSYSVRLSKTMEDNVSPPLISDATVFITDDNGSISILENRGSGIYKTDSTVFRGTVGRKYILSVITKEGMKYESEPCLMQSVPDIDSIYFIKDQELTDNGTVTHDGIRILLDSDKGDGTNYYRWDFEETWKFRIPYPRRFDYIDKNTIIPIANVKQYCWKTSKSQGVMVRSIYSGLKDRIEKEPIFFIATDKSDRLALQYSILIKQYSLSKNEYEFWENIKRVNESGGDIFAAIPFPVISNIHNIENPKERVLGYFQVSAVRQKRKFISFNEIARLNLPFYRNACERIEATPGDYSTGAFDPGMKWDQLYEMFTVNAGYYFIEPMYTETHTLDKLVFARPECVNCESNGTMTKPDYWPGSD